MAGNDLQFVISVDIAKPRSPVVDVLMTDPVKSVTANPELLGNVHRECVVVSLGGDAAVKGSVENALNSYYKSLAQAQAGTALIMSSKSDETSLESSGLRQGVFSHFLIRGLKGEADVDGNQIVSVQELYDYIGENVRTYTGMRQSPVIKGDYDGKMTVSVIR